jgi:hypothetical protein
MCKQTIVMRYRSLFCFLTNRARKYGDSYADSDMCRQPLKQFCTAIFE